MLGLVITGASNTSVNSVQLSLPLDLGPWDGVSPRYLTRVHKVFSFPRERMTWPTQDPIHGLQIEMFPEGTPYGS